MRYSSGWNRDRLGATVAWSVARSVRGVVPPGFLVAYFVDEREPSSRSFVFGGREHARTRRRHEQGALSRTPRCLGVQVIWRRGAPRPGRCSGPGAASSRSPNRTKRATAEVGATAGDARRLEPAFHQHRRYRRVCQDPREVDRRTGRCDQADRGVEDGGRAPLGAPVDRRSSMQCRHSTEDYSSGETGCPNSGHASLRHSYPCSGPAKAVLAGCPQSGHNGGVTAPTVRASCHRRVAQVRTSWTRPVTPSV